MITVIGIIHYLIFFFNREFKKDRVKIFVGLCSGIGRRKGRGILGIWEETPREGEEF